MLTRSSEAVWHGNLREGHGTMYLGYGTWEGPYSFKSRFEEGTYEGTNPEELLAAAHAGCFSMAVSNELAKAGHPPNRAHTTANVKMEKGDAGFEVTEIELVLEAEVPGIDEDEFQRIANHARENCPLSKALRAVEITLKAKLV